MTEESQRKGSCLLLGINDLQMLVPRTIVAEVIRHSFLDFRTDESSGLDSFEWRGCQVPLIRNKVLGDIPESTIDEESRVVIFYGLKKPQQLPFYGVTVTRSPQLLQVGDEDLEEVQGQSLHPAELMKVRVKDSEAFIPKVDHFENALLQLL